jgi:hypothetical protein
MSDIPRAREILKKALEDWWTSDALDSRVAIREALKFLDRKKPEFVAARKVRALSPYNVEYARELRRVGLSLHEIAVKLKTNVGRVSEACA